MAVTSCSLCTRNNNNWFYTQQQMDNSPSRRNGLDPDKELSYRQQAANLIQDMGQRLGVSQLSINTAIVYMHRFYMIQSFTRFHKNAVAPAALFLAAKVEEQPRKLEHVVRVAHTCLNRQGPSLDGHSYAYLPQVQGLVNLENIILQTLGFEIIIEHPHVHVIRCTELVGVSTKLAQAAYLMATQSLHLTTFCLQYSPSVVACACIHLASKRFNCGIPVSTDGKPWWEIVDPTVTLEMLDELTRDFLQILTRTPSRLRLIHIWRPRLQKKAEHSKLPASSESRKTTQTARFSLPTDGANPSPGLVANSKAAVNIDQLKRRAERFGMNGTSISQKVEEDGKLKKRKERCWIVTSAGSTRKDDAEAKKIRRD